MAAIHEWRCTFHDHEFEGPEPKCPYGCSPKFVRKEFRTPVSIGSHSTKLTDGVRKQLAADFNLTDMRNDKEGTSVMSNTRVESGGARVIGDQGRPYWNAVMFPNANPGWAARGEQAPVYNPAAARLQGPLARVGNREVETRIPISAIREGASRHLRAATRLVGPQKKA